jgi:photosystem II stability/assembly factor-like uncharacterized protein
MKNKVLVLTLVLLMAACVPAVTAEPTQTVTLIPTQKPNPTPSATLTGTDTPPILPAPYSLTPTLTSPAMAHFVPGQKIDIRYIDMVDVNQGWGIGGLNKASDHVFRTQDGGQTWRDVTPPQPAPDASATNTALGYFLNAATAWVANGPSPESGGMPPFIQVWKTIDGGGTWSYSSIDTSVVSGETFSPYFLNFADTQHGWLMVYLGAGMMHAYVALFMTIDGGATWTDILDPLTVNDIQSFPKTGMIFVDPQTGWLTRDAQGVDPTPHIFRTTDSGVTWTRLDLPTPAEVPNLYVSYACGSYSPNAFSALSVTVTMKCLDLATYKIEKDYVYFTSDGGITWQTYPLPADYSLGKGLYFFSPQSGLALGRKIYKTTDGGQTWKFIQQVSWDGQFSFVSMDLGWAYVFNDQGENALVKTINGGETWTMLNPVVGP